MIYVTHDQVEAMTHADKIAVLRDGLFEQVGRPMDLYRKPANKFVAGFMGNPKMNFFDASADKGKVTIDGFGAMGSGRKELSGDMSVGIQPEHFQQTTKAKAIVSGRLELVEQLGEYALVHLLTGDDQMITAKMDFSPQIKHGGEMYFTVAPEYLHMFDKKTGKRI